MLRELTGLDAVRAGQLFELAGHDLAVALQLHAEQPDLLDHSQSALVPPAFPAGEPAAAASGANAAGPSGTGAAACAPKHLRSATALARRKEKKKERRRRQQQQLHGEAQADADEGQLRALLRLARKQRERAETVGSCTRRAGGAGNLETQEAGEAPRQQEAAQGRSGCPSPPRACSLTALPPQGRLAFEPLPRDWEASRPVEHHPIPLRHVAEGRAHERRAEMVGWVSRCLCTD